MEGDTAIEMFRKRKKRQNQQQRTDFDPDCTHSQNYNDLVEREVDGFRVLSIQCKMCDTFGHRPVAFVLDDENVRIPDFETLSDDTEIELYYKLNFLSHIPPNRQTRILIAKVKQQLKVRFDALKYDDPKEGTRQQWKANRKAMHAFFDEVEEVDG